MIEPDPKVFEVRKWVTNLIDENVRCEHLLSLILQCKCLVSFEKLLNVVSIDPEVRNLQGASTNLHVRTKRCQFGTWLEKTWWIQRNMEPAPYPYTTKTFRAASFESEKNIQTEHSVPLVVERVDRLSNFIETSTSIQAFGKKNQ